MASRDRPRFFALGIPHCEEDVWGCETRTQVEQRNAPGCLWSGSSMPERMMGGSRDLCRPGYGRYCSSLRGMVCEVVMAEDSGCHKDIDAMQPCET